MSILFEASFTSGYVHICLQSMNLLVPLPFHSSRLCLFLFAHPWLYSTSDHSAQHESKSRQWPTGHWASDWWRAVQSVLVSWDYPNHVLPKWHYPAVVNHYLNEQSGRRLHWQSVLSHVFIWRPIQIDLECFLFARGVCYTMSSLL